MAAKRCCNLVVSDLVPTEIIEWEILTRLPVKSLIRFKSVCKSWNLLIRNPDFIRSQLDRNPNKDFLILRSAQIEYETEYVSLLQMDTTVIGSTNGLVCFFNWHQYIEAIEIAIWNPATKQCLIDIPPLPKRHEDRIFDDCFGFGFDSITNDFKIMYVITIEDQPLLGDIYSCNARCWNKITPSNFVFRGGMANYTQCVIFSGSPYWLNIQYNNEKSHIFVVWFDVRNEVFRMLPEVASIVTQHGIRSTVLVNFRDSIAVMNFNSKLFLNEPVDVYIFNERCSVWRKTSIGPIVRKELVLRTVGQFFQCFRNDNILFMSHDRKLYCINLRTLEIKSFKSLGNEGELCIRILWGCNYAESLIFIEGMEHFDEKADQVGIFFVKEA